MDSGQDDFEESKVHFGLLKVTLDPFKPLWTPQSLVDKVFPIAPRCEVYTMLKKSVPNLNHPPHIFADDSLYFVTVALLYRSPLLAPPTHKPHLQEQLLTLAPDYGVDLKAWVILDTHYHILSHLAEGDKLSRFFQRLHAKTATTFNQWDRQIGRQVWWNYWDWCIRNDRDYWTHFNRHYRK